MLEWINFMQKSYTNLYGPKILVFKLDKTATPIDDLYGEEKYGTGRVYLPPFEIASLHEDNKWAEVLNSAAAMQEEQPLSITVNFEDMVQKIREKKNGRVSNLYIKYIGNRGTPFAEKKDNILNIYLNNVIIYSFNLKDAKFSTVRKLGSYINDYDDWECELEGSNDLSVNLVNFNKTNFSGQKICLYSQDMVYNNVEDVINEGDCIVTNKLRCYEVMSGQPAGDFGFKYVTWRLSCKIASIDNYNLPGNYVEQIRLNDMGIKKKLNIL